jgi:hypothetical protein
MKKRFVFVTLLIAMVVLTQMPVSLVHTATSNGTEYQLALNFLERVAGMNMSEYTVLSSNVSGFRMLDSQRYQTDVRIVISNNNHTSDVLITFVDGKFWIYDLNLSPVQLVGDKTLNDCLSMAKRAIEEYRAGFNATYLDGLEEMISVAIQNQSLIVENDNTLLKISYIENCSTPLDYKRYTKLQWFKKIEHQYTVPAQSFSLSVSKDGLLTMLMDNLAIYHVASTEINISEGEAINVSIPYAEVYAREHGQGIVSANATLNWVRDLDSLRGNDSAIYPVWIISMTYSKTNEESVFGYSVLIWADNCEIIRHGPRIFLETTNSSHNPYLWLILVPIPIILAFICLMTYSRRKDKNKKG